MSTPFPVGTGVRTATGAARESGRFTVLQNTPLDEHAPPDSPPHTVRPQRGPDGRFLPQNTAGRMAKVRAGSGGALAGLEAKADPVWRAADRWGKRYTQHRIGELTGLYGELSSGVLTALVSAGATLADARYLRALAASTGNADLLVKATQLSKEARLCERDALAIAALEAKSRPDPALTAMAQAKVEFQRRLMERQGGGQ